MGRQKRSIEVEAVDINAVDADTPDSAVPEGEVAEEAATGVLTGYHSRRTAGHVDMRALSAEPSRPSTAGQARP